MCVPLVLARPFAAAAAAAAAVAAAAAAAADVKFCYTFRSGVRVANRHRG